ncbi:alpha/beta fold hydrolase [Streptomyces sp. NPDC006012]|uniref:alpha/beta fold hydrolase n=1 Tax=Streptomyces sp. NPDC006012 TaxID=3364739 RepID=UPI0036A2AC0E
MPPPVMLRRGTLLASTVLLSGLLLPSASAVPKDAPASSKGAGALDWRPCTTVAKDWPIPDDRTECAQLTVPLDYSTPQGRKINVAVSRLKAGKPGSNTIPLVYGTGGPGLLKVSAPAGVLETGLSPLAVDHDIVSMDDRGASYSDKIECDPGESPDAPPTAGPRERIKAEFDAQSEFNQRCVAKDPEFVRQLTPANAARDLDSFRQALGAPKIDYYGVSFSTAVGIAYRSLFDDRVSHMWLDSVLPPVFDHSAMDAAIEAVGSPYGSFAQWLARHDVEYHLGTDPAALTRKLADLRDELDRKPRVVGDEVMNGDWVVGLASSTPSGWVTSAIDLVTVLEGGLPEALPKTTGDAKRRPFGYETPHGGMNGLQYNAMLCNGATSPTDFSGLWGALQARRTADPLKGSYFSPWCADWPLKVPPTPVKRGTSPLQLSGHTYETVTPFNEAQETQKAIGGGLLTVQDDVHSSLSHLPCVSKVLEFFRNGRTTNGTCPGVQ